MRHLDNEQNNVRGYKIDTLTTTLAVQASDYESNSDNILSRNDMAGRNHTKEEDHISDLPDDFEQLHQELDRRNKIIEALTRRNQNKKNQLKKKIIEAGQQIKALQQQGQAIDSSIHKSFSSVSTEIQQQPKRKQSTSSSTEESEEEPKSPPIVTKEDMDKPSTSGMQQQAKATSSNKPRKYSKYLKRFHIDRNTIPRPRTTTGKFKSWTSKEHKNYRKIKKNRVLPKVILSSEDDIEEIEEPQPTKYQPVAEKVKSTKAKPTVSKVEIIKKPTISKESQSQIQMKTPIVKLQDIKLHQKPWTQWLNEMENSIKETAARIQKQQRQQWRQQEQQQKDSSEPSSKDVSPTSQSTPKLIRRKETKVDKDNLHTQATSIKNISPIPTVHSKVPRKLQLTSETSRSLSFKNSTPTTSFWDVSPMSRPITNPQQVQDNTWDISQTSQTIINSEQTCDKQTTIDISQDNTTESIRTDYTDKLQIDTSHSESDDSVILLEDLGTTYEHEQIKQERKSPTQQVNKSPTKQIGDTPAARNTPTVRIPLALDRVSAKTNGGRCSRTRLQEGAAEAQPEDAQ
ncbi:DNA ligase 1-like [Harpegnathos saltator]|uniref:DNA ligase 1-like n=1 Tax=Harpegnathos saltator TaxID=610380 RepID=UPI000DBEE83A|nr:DNA ligase 1-like [Harpegnathos saltator]